MLTNPDNLRVYTTVYPGIDALSTVMLTPLWLYWPAQSKSQRDKGTCNELCLNPHRILQVQSSVALMISMC